MSDPSDQFQTQVHHDGVAEVVLNRPPVNASPTLSLSPPWKYCCGTKVPARTPSS